ncbi:MAG: hypothetical protein QOJ64_3903 [Acidobacteriota bacterium]|nr:hypothetical protein [Acidobacteriota bacterium]
MNERAEVSPSIRRAKPHEAELLSDIALRSKGHWGYDAEFLERCRPLLTISSDEISKLPIFVLEMDRRILGFYGLREFERGMELLYLFVEPSAMHRGYGKLLWNHAVETASAAGSRRLLIESDPFAEPFYLAMGARRIGLAPSSVQPGRRLPLLELPLDPELHKSTLT